MFYVKNLPGWERVLRVVLGTGGVVYAIIEWGSSKTGVGLGAAAAVLALTGFIGFCPMCAMIGRKLKKED